jgi:hypothetical protein
MRISKERARQIQVRPLWLKNDRDWFLFKDYRDSDQSADGLSVLYMLSRAQCQNIIRNILTRFGRTGEVSTRTARVLKSLGLTLEPEKLRQELEELKVVADFASADRGLEYYFINYVTGCGPSTIKEILKLYEEMDSDCGLNPAA